VWASADATIPEAAEQAPEQPLTHLLKHCRLGYHPSHGRGHSSRGGNGNSPPLSVPIVTRRRSLENYTKGANGELIRNGRGGGGGGVVVGTFTKANAGPSGLSKSDNNVEELAAAMRGVDGNVDVDGRTPFNIADLQEQSRRGFGTSSTGLLYAPGSATATPRATTNAFDDDDMSVISTQSVKARHSNALFGRMFRNRRGVGGSPGGGGTGPSSSQSVF
jgi:hypothetical protein